MLHLFFWLGILQWSLFFFFSFFFLIPHLQIHPTLFKQRYLKASWSFIFNCLHVWPRNEAICSVGGDVQCYCGQCMLCAEKKRVSVLRLNIPRVWKTKAGGRESKFYKHVAWPFLPPFRCFFLFFFPHTNFLSFLIALYQLLVAEGHCVQLMSWPKQGPGGKTNPTATLLRACVSSIAALLGKRAFRYPCYGIAGTLQVKCQQDVSCLILKCFPSAFCGWVALSRRATIREI